MLSVASFLQNLFTSSRILPPGHKSDLFVSACPNLYSQANRPKARFRYYSRALKMSLMKLRYALLFSSLFLAHLSQAQVRFKVKLLADNVTYQVLLKPDVTWNAPSNAVPSAQITIVVPTGGFQVGNIANISGSWNNNANIVAPPENPGFDYIVFGLSGVTSAITFQKDVEVALFTFKNNGKCTGALDLIEHATDPFMPPNSQSVNVGNQISVIAAGMGVNAYSGNYGVLSPDCKGASGCGVQIFDISMKSPTACGLANGSIKITATNTNGLPLQYSIDNGVTFQSSDSFPSLAAGKLFEVIVRDVAALCSVSGGSFEMEGPLAAVITGVDRNHPSCDSTNGSLVIHAYSELGNPIQYAIGKPEFFQSSNTFSGLAPGFYKLYVRDAVKDCINEVGTYELEACPPPPCIITYKLEKLPNDKFQMSMITDTTWNFPNNIVSSAQWTVKVPTGGFKVAKLTSLVPGVTFSEASSYIAPTEEPGSDYISFILGSPGTTNISFIKGQTVPLFTFENSGTCQGGQVVLMDNKNDPFFPPNSQNANVGQQITVSGYGGADVPVCISNLPAPDCTLDPCKKLVANFTAGNLCHGDTLVPVNTTTTVEPVIKWSWNWGDGTPLDTAKSPKHKYALAGTYSVILTAITNGGCTSSVTKNIVINPVPGPAPQTYYFICPGDTVQLKSPTGVAANWTPTTGLSNPNTPSPFAYPLTRTVYTVTYTNAFTCTSSSSVEVNVGPVPVINSVVGTDLASCDIPNGKIEISATGSSTITYSINNGATWQDSSIFRSLGAGNYLVLIKYTGATCSASYANNPVVLKAPSSASISKVNSTQPTGCNMNGAIEIIATGGVAPLQYSINGGVSFQASNIFQNIGRGTYQIVISNSNGSCKVLWSEKTELRYQDTIRFLTSPADFESCEGQNAQVKFITSEKILSYQINSTGTYSNDLYIDSMLRFDFIPQADTTIYRVNIRGTSNCVISDTFKVIKVLAPLSTFRVNSPQCLGSEIELEYTGNAGPSAKLNWNVDGGQIVASSDSSAAGPKAGKISVIWNSGGSKLVILTVEHGGCQATGSNAVVINDFKPGPTMGITHVTTCGANTGAIKLGLTVPGNYTFLWKGPGANGVTQQSLNNLPGGIYTVAISDGLTGCVATASGTVDYPLPFKIDSISTIQVTNCDIGQPNGELKVNISGGDASYSYKLYKVPETNVAFDSVTSAHLQHQFTNLPAGRYIVKVVTAKGCSDTLSASISSVADKFYVASTSVSKADCGQFNGSVQVVLNGGTSPFKYYIFKNGKLESSNLLQNSNTLTLANLEGGEYSVILEDQNGCVISSSATVGAVSSTVNITSIQKNPTCGKADGSIELAGYPTGASFKWVNNPGLSLPDSFIVNQLPAGVYQVVITDLKGCTSTHTYLLPASTNADISILEQNNASCGNASGKFSFKVLKSGPFTYSIHNSKTTGTGMPGDTISLGGFDSGAYVIEVKDTSSTCISYLPVVIQGTIVPQISAVTTPPSSCGVQDASICLQLSKGNGPYTLSSNYGTIPSLPFQSEACVNGLYDQLVNLSITDSVGCTFDMSFSLPKQPEVALKVEDFTVQSYTCPDVLGKLTSNTGLEYSVYDTNNVFIGKTPMNKVPAGVYKIVHSVGNCTANQIVTIRGPVAWKLNVTAKAESCAGSDGELELTASGGTGAYSILWSTGDTVLFVSKLKASNSYAVTVTDSLGCKAELKNIVLPYDCKVVCPQVFTVDTFKVLMIEGLNEICLPTTVSTLTGYSLNLNGSTYTGNVSFCLDSTIFYSYGILMNFGAPPFELEAWSFNGKQAAKFIFNKMDELVTYLNTLDPAGNWAYNSSDKTIFGGIKKGVYGSLSIKHRGTNNILSLQVNTLAVARPTIFVPQADYHVFIVRDIATGCLDTLFINRHIPPPVLKDSMSVNVTQGSKQNICFPTTGLSSNIISFTIKCVSNGGMAIYKHTGTQCIEIEGMKPGMDTSCFEICDDKGACKTFYLTLEVRDSSTNLVVYNAISPNEDGMNDVLHVKNIELYPDNHLYIFNRWGLQVLSKQGYSNSDPWDGRFKNQQLPDGSYFYILQVKINGTVEKRTGYIEIRR